MKSPAKIVKFHKLSEVKKVVIKIPEKDDVSAMAKYMEAEGRHGEAIKLYEKLIKTEPYREYNYNRLMMIYRKQKDFKNELRIIDTGIKAFSNFYMPSAVGKHKSIISLSKKLNTLTGLTDKRGNSLSDTEPIGKWKKRREIVMKKIKVKKK